MTNEIVKYHNDLNTVSMRKWTKEEMNFFFAIIVKAKEKGTKTLVFETVELKELSQFADRHNQRWDTVMKNVADKVMELKYIEKTPRKYAIMALFQFFQVDFDKRIVHVELSNRFEYILNQLQANFTVWELEQFTKIRSTYAKTMYRLLKQYRVLGKLRVRMEEFRHILGIPEGYKLANIDTRVLKPIQEQLSPYFEGLKITKVKSKEKGNPVVAFDFTFKPEKVKSKTKKTSDSQESIQIDYGANEMLETFKKVITG